MVASNDKTTEQALESEVHAISSEVGHLRPEVREEHELLVELKDQLAFFIARESAPQTCKRCNETFDPRFPAGCRYHIGTGARGGECDCCDEPRWHWTCCNKTMNMPGCHGGDHVPQAKGMPAFWQMYMDQQAQNMPSLSSSPPFCA